MSDKGLQQKIRATERFLQAIELCIDHKIIKSMRQLAPEIGLHPSALTAMKSGSGRYVGVENIILLCEKYPVNREFILTGTGAVLKDGERPTPMTATISEIEPSLVTQLYEALDGLEGETATTLKTLVNRLIDENQAQKDKIITLMNDLIELQTIIKVR